MPGPPYRGFCLHAPTSQPDDYPLHSANTVFSLFQQARMGANVARVTLGWGGINWEFANGPLPPIQETSVHAPFDYTQLDYMKAIVDIIRTQENKPDFGLLVVIGTGPPDWAGSGGTGRYSTTPTGWDQMGQTVAKIVNYLNQQPSGQVKPNRCVGIELFNEPNFTRQRYKRDANGNIVYENGQPVIIVNNGAMEVPAVAYGGMAAYVLYWLHQCCGTKPNGDLNVFPLCGSLALGGKVNTGIWTENLSPTSYLQTFGYVINTILVNDLLSSNTNLAWTLNGLWRLSIHPYPQPGTTVDTDPVGWATDPNNNTGDTDHVKASDRVWNHYVNYQDLVGNRKTWITETGASSRKLGLPGQANFHQRLAYLAATRHSNNDKRLEGVTNFGFLDLDPLVDDPAWAFYKMGVVSASDGQTLKPAGTTLSTVYNSLWT